jgi:hypothetical protein
MSSSAIINPSLLSGQNPSGSSISIPQLFSSSSGQNPMLPSGPTSPGSAPSTPNPYGSSPSGSFPAYGFGTPSSTLPTIGSSGAPGGYGGGGGVLGLGVGSQGGFSQLQKGLDTIYGSGVGNMLTQFLASGAGYNPQVLQQLFAQLQPQFAQQQQNLMQQFSASGNRFGSGAQIGYSNLLGQQGLEEGDIASQLYEQAVQNYMSVLTGAGAETAAHPQPSFWDQLSGILNMSQTVLGAASGVTSSVNPGADTGILDALAGA